MGIKKLSSPVRLLFVTIVSIFTIETLVMFILTRLPTISPVAHAFLDSLLLVLLVFPALYFSMYRPLVLHITHRKKSEERIYKSNQIQRVINSILKTALKPVSMDKLLESVLDISLSIPWHKKISQGAIFLVEDDPGKLVLKVQRGLLGQYLPTYETKDFGGIFCGGTNFKHKIQLASCLNDRSPTRGQCSKPQSHYCIPILSENKVLGAMVLNIELEHKESKYEEGILMAISRTLAGIIKRMQAEDALRKERDKARMYLDIAGVMMMTLGADQRVSLINKKGCEILGYEESEIIGKKWFENFLPERIREEVKLVSAKLMAGEINPVEYYENPILTKSGQERLISWHNTTLRDDEGRITGHLSSGEDITERKRREEMLKTKKQEIEELNVNLEKRVQEELNKSHQKDAVMMHQSRLAAMGEMIGFIAHQWKQPLNALNILLYNIKDCYECDELDQEILDDFVSKGVEMVMNMANTIDDFRSFFKPNKEKEKFSINKIIKDSLTLVDASFKYNHISVVLNEYEQLTTTGLANEYSQVVLNILNNAKDAITSRGVDGKVVIDISLEQNSTVLKIKDNGGGIPEDILPKVFDPYFTTKAGAMGTGIGLYMSKVIIEGHMDGHVDVHNADGGVEFKVTTPNLAITSEVGM